MDSRPAPPTAHTLWLEIDAGGDLIRGRLGDEREHWVFAGWLELASALHSATAPGRTSAESEDECTRDTEGEL